MKFNDNDRLRLQKFLRPTESGCLIFMGRLNHKGYGEFVLGGRTEKAHRVAFFMAGGVLTAEKPCVLHSCDVPSCCEPSHLWAGTKRENVEDMLAKGRQRKSRRGWPFGVSPVGRKFKAALRINGEYRYFGVHSTVETAASIAEFVKNVVAGKAFLIEETEGGDALRNAADTAVETTSFPSVPASSNLAVKGGEAQRSLMKKSIALGNEAPAGADSPGPSELPIFERRD